MKTQPQLNIFDELIVDSFAGGGGASTGIELAVGRPVDIAINHDPDAILMHKTNHPYTKHYQASVWDVDPLEVCHGQKVGLAWFSPDCKHFSKAKGGKPVEKKIRGLAWIVLRWAAKVHPRVIILENVEEFQTWGPVRRGRPVKSKAGQTFERWLFQLRALGYQIEYRELRACDYGAPTIRKRFFLIARCDGQSIVWPAPTYGDPQSPEVKAGKLKPWRSAAEIIDWSLPCPSIFDTSNEVMQKHGLKAVRPLADNTMKRVARGVDKFVLNNPKPFIINTNHTSSKTEYDCFRGSGLDDPFNTVTAKNGYGIVTPVLAVNNSNHTGSSPEEPVCTVTTGGHHMLITPVMTAIGQTGFKSDRCRGVEQPVNTTVSKAESCLVAPSLIQYHSEQNDYMRGQSVEKSIQTVDSSNRYGLAAANLVEYFSTGRPLNVNEPLHTSTAKDREALTVSYLSKFYKTGIGQSLNDPLHTVTTSQAHFGEVRTYLVKATPGCNLHKWPLIRDILNRYCDYHIADDEVLIIEIDGVQYFIADIGLRMLSARELYAANGFPADYIIDRDYLGNVYPKSKQVARCGNAVPPPFAYSLIIVNLPELCVKSCKNMTDLNDTIAV